MPDSTKPSATASTATPAVSARPGWQVVAQREIYVKLHDRNFLISIGVTLLLLVGMFGVQGWAGSRTSTTSVAVPASAGGGPAPGTALVEAAGKAAKGDGARVAYTVRGVASDAAARQAVRDGAADVALIRTGTGWHVVGNKSVDSSFTKYVTAAAEQQALTTNAAAQHVDIKSLTKGSSVTVSTLSGDGTDAGLATVVAFVFVFLFYLATILFGMPIAQSVVEEKQSRIVEILASAVPLRQLLFGKILGNTVLAIAQVVLIVAVALIGLSRTKWASAVGAIAGASGWFIVFFLAGFLVVACMFAVAGAISSRSEDLQATVQPVMMLIMGTLVVGMFLKGTALTIASYVPVISSVAMPSRLAAGTASWWEPLIALLITAVAVVGVTRVATRLYTRSILHTGGRLSYRAAFGLSE